MRQDQVDKLKREASRTASAAFADGERARQEAALRERQLANQLADLQRQNEVGECGVMRIPSASFCVQKMRFLYFFFFF